MTNIILNVALSMLVIAAIIGMMLYFADSLAKNENICLAYGKKPHLEYLEMGEGTANGYTCNYYNKDTHRACKLEIYSSVHKNHRYLYKDHGCNVTTVVNFEDY